MSSFISRTVLSVVLVLIAGMLAVVAFGFLCAALYLGVAQLAGPPMAALATAMAVTLLAALLLLAAHFVTKRRSPHARPSPSTRRETLGGSLSAELAAEIEDVTRKHTFGALTGAVVTGIVLGVNPHLRRDLLHLLRSPNPIQS